MTPQDRRLRKAANRLDHAEQMFTRAQSALVEARAEYEAAKAAAEYIEHLMIKETTT